MSKTLKLDMFAPPFLMTPIGETGALGKAVAQIGHRVQKAEETKKRLQSEEARYTLILHSVRKNLGLTLNEYCLADSIHKLSSNRSSVPGWCYASKEHLANSLGLTRQSAHTIINKLKEKDLVEQDPETGYVRTTEAWRLEVEVTKTRVFGDR